MQRSAFLRPAFLAPGSVPLAALACVLAVPAAAAPGEPPRLSLEQRMKLRCSAAFALVAERQARGDPAVLRYPAVGPRGREYFVRSAASVMDEAHLDRAAIDTALRIEARDLAAPGALEAIMPICLEALEGSGL